MVLFHLEESLTMNEKIKQLAKEAGIWFEDSKEIRTHNISTTTLERFAKLIINDSCAALHPVLRDMISRGKGVDLIKEHFGVDK